jgi:hypothetical protein
MLFAGPPGHSGVGRRASTGCRARCPISRQGETRQIVARAVLPGPIANRYSPENLVCPALENKASGKEGEESQSCWRYLLEVESVERPGPFSFVLPSGDVKKTAAVADGSEAAEASGTAEQQPSVLVTEVAQSAATIHLGSVSLA